MTEHPKLGVHLQHCNFGEYPGECKYGDTDCPALTDAWSWFGYNLQRAKLTELITPKDAVLEAINRLLTRVKTYPNIFSGNDFIRELDIAGFEITPKRVYDDW